MRLVQGSKHGGGTIFTYLNKRILMYTYVYTLKPKGNDRKIIKKMIKYYYPLWEGKVIEIKGEREGETLKYA